MSNSSMVITLGNIVFGGKGNGGGKPAAYVVPDGMNFGYTSLTEFPFDDFDFSQKTNFDHCWYNCQSLASFPVIDTSKGTNFAFAWDYCQSLKSFPQLDLSSGTDFSNAWYWCSSLTSFPMLDLSSGTDFEKAWYYCYNMAEFPALNLSSGTNFYNAWNGCSSFTTMGQLDLSNGTNFTNAWRSCGNLTNLGGFGAIKESIDLSASTLLTVDSIMNVINQAATVTGKTMTLGSTNLNKLTDEQKAVATNKGWTLA